MTNRRNFIKTAGLASAALGLGLPRMGYAAGKEELYKISLAQWSLNKPLFAGKMDNLDFAIEAKKHQIEAVEYVNQFFKDKAKDKSYLQEMKTRAAGEGVTSVLIMIDGEGHLGASTEKGRLQTVENHKKWVEAAKFLGCHSIRINAYAEIPFSRNPKKEQEALKLCAPTFRSICEFADDFDINIIIENHGSYSSNAQWLATLIKQTDHRRAGTLPDFGNFRMGGEGTDIQSYDSYRGVDELMPLAKGVSLKPTVWDGQGNQYPLDYARMMKIVLAHGYHGHVGIEHGEEGREWESITEVRQKLLEVREEIAG